jgi:putative ABC transport system permease protein
VRRLLPYQVHLALRGLVRTRGLSLAILTGMACSTAIWTAVVAHYFRVYGPHPALSPALHQVELPHTSTLTKAFGGANAVPAEWTHRTRVTFGEYQQLAGTGIPSRETGLVRARLLVGRQGAPLDPDGAQARITCARFVNADFFSLFRIPIAPGRAFDTGEDRASAPVAVLGQRMAEDLFGAARAAVGQTVIVEGRAFRVVGVVDGDQPFRSEWDLASTGGDQDSLYLPFAWFTAMLAPPDLVLYQTPAAGWRFQDLLRSDAVYVAHWLELPTPAARAAYARHLDQRFGQRGVAYQLRSWAAWQAAFPMPNSTIRFFTLLGLMAMLGSGFNVARLLLAKGSAVRDELAIHRSLGATRGAIFGRQMLEALMLSVVAALVGVVLAVPYNALFNNVVADTDIPVRLTALVLAAGIGGALCTGLAAALYPAWRLARTRPAVQAGRA